MLFHRPIGGVFDLFSEERRELLLNPKLFFYDIPRSRYRHCVPVCTSRLTANVLSKLLFSWVSPLMTRGNDKYLGEEVGRADYIVSSRKRGGRCSNIIHGRSV